MRRGIVTILGAVIVWALPGTVTTTALGAPPPLEPEQRRPETVVYTVEKPVVGPSGLTASVDGRTFRIIDPDAAAAKRGGEDAPCLALEDQRDFDGNGTTDALVAHILACGGNAVGNTFFFVSHAGGGRFERTDDFGYDWDAPRVERWRNTWSVVVESSDEETTADLPRETRSRYVLRNGRAVKVEVIERKPLPALVELVPSQFRSGQDEETRRLSFDLDGDGRKDTITGILWQRWGRIVWTVQFANGSSFDGCAECNCRRVGVLKSRTLGVNDLVCDHDAVFRWDGTAYGPGK